MVQIEAIRASWPASLGQSVRYGTLTDDGPAAQAGLHQDDHRDLQRRPGLHGPAAGRYRPAPDARRIKAAALVARSALASYAYCSAGVNMVGQMLGKSTGLWLPRMFDSFLARPMQFADYGINLMPSGEAYSGGGMHLLPRDFLKFGQLYLDGGLWHGKRLVSAAWVRESTAHQIDRADGSDDGFGWHRHTLAVGARRFQTYEASGNGGQFLVVVPALQLAVVVTAGNYGEYPVWQKIRQELIPAIMGAMR